MSEIQSPSLLLEQLEDCLLRMAAGDPPAYDEYEEARVAFLTAPDLLPFAPDWLIRLRYSTQMWSWLKAQSDDVAIRQATVKKALAAVHKIAEATPGAVEVMGGKIVLWASDMDRSIHFYKGVFGAAVLLHTPVISTLQIADQRLGIHNGGDGETTWTGLAFQVADVVAAAQAVTAQGGFLEREPEPENGEPPHLAMCMDPDKNQFMLFRKR